MLEKVYEDLKEAFFREARKEGIDVSEEDFLRSTGLSASRSGRRWKVVLTIPDPERRIGKRCRTVANMPDGEKARRIVKYFQAAKHVQRALERLEELKGEEN